MMRNLWISVVAAGAVALVGCSDEECVLDDPESCDSGLVCERVVGSEAPRCFAPVELRGRVFDLETDGAVADARVVAQDVNGAPVGGVASTNGEGAYVLRIPTDRSDEAGTPVGRKLTLRAAAQDYQTFPSGLRVALPLDTGAVTRDGEEGPWALVGGQADIGLSLLPEADRGHPRVSGKADVAAGQGGLLVVAEAGAGVPGVSAIAGTDGEFVLFNVRPGSWRVRGYGRGVNYTPADVTVQAGTDVSDVRLARREGETATVTGTVSIVAASGQTSVIMVPASTFNENLARGELPPGLRAPEPGTAPNVTGSFSISGVPDGDYVMLAAFENDGLVRDPDPNIAGTEIQRVTVTNGQPDRQPAFKVTGAMTLLSPGGGDALEETSATPGLTFRSYSSAKTYVLSVFDTFGNKVWETTRAAGSGDLTVAYAGPALRSGAVYQWRVMALGNADNPISVSEDLKGVFRVQ